MTKNRILLIVIVVLGFVLRFYNLSNIPPHPSLDEVSIGYNAFSILNTGKDEYGNSLPILLRAYDDYRPAMYVYTVVPLIKLLGLTTLSVRLPSAFLSTFTIVVVYFLAKEIIVRSNSKKYLYSVPVISSLLLAISPWHIYISRLGHEVNLFYSSFIFGLFCFFRFINSGSRKFLFLASIFLSLSFMSYQSGKVFIPLMIVLLIFLYWRVLLRSKKTLILAFTLGLLIVTPLLIESSRPEALIRFSATNIYSGIDSLLEKSAKKVLDAKNSNDILGQITNNRRWVYLTLPLGAYSSHFSPEWLFSNSGEEHFKAPGIGLFHEYEVITILFGLYILAMTKSFKSKEKIFIVGWMLVSIVPGAITNGYPHAMRIFQVLPAPQLLSAFAVSFLLTKYKKTAIHILLFFIVVLSFSRLYVSYFINLPIEIADQFQFGVLQSFEKSKEIQSEYNTIYVSNKDNLFQSYMFFLYQEEYDPEQYLLEGGTVSGGFEERHVIGKYKFGFIPEGEGNLIISNPDEYKKDKIIDRIYFPDGEEAIWLVEN